MSAVPPPVPQPIEITARRTDPLAVTALVLAVVAGLVSALSGPITLALQVRAGAPIGVLGVATGIPTLVLGAVALVIGLVALARPGARRGLAGAGAGLGGFLAAGQVVGFVALLLLSVAR